MDRKDVVLGAELRRYRETLKPQSRPPGMRAGNKLPQDDAERLINARLVEKGKRPIGRGMLQRMEKGQAVITLDVVEAAEEVYNLRDRQLTNVYLNPNTVKTPGKSALDAALVAQALLPTKTVPVAAYLGAGTREWRLSTEGRDLIEVDEYLSDMRVVRLGAEGGGGFPPRTLIAFFPDSDIHRTAWMLLKNKQDPDLLAIRHVSSADRGLLVGDPDDRALIAGDWEPIGWAYGWAVKEGLTYPEWRIRKGGVGPSESRNLR